MVRGDRDVGQITAQKRVYDVRRDLMTEAGIDAGLTRDLFIALGEPMEDGQAWSVRIQTKPYIRWIWFGTIFMALGGLMAALDRRYRRVAEKSAVSKVRQKTAGKAGTDIGQSPVAAKTLHPSSGQAG